MKTDRFWVRYGQQGQVVVLYRLSSPDMAFQRWDSGVWVAAYDQYQRVTQDAEIPEVDADAAMAAIDAMS